MNGRTFSQKSSQARKKATTTIATQNRCVTIFVIRIFKPQADNAGRMKTRKMNKLKKKGWVGGGLEGGKT